MNRARKPASLQLSLPPSAPSSHDHERIRSAASIATDQLTVHAYGFPAIHSSITSRAAAAYRSSPVRRNAWPAGSSHCTRDSSHGILTSLGRSRLAYSIRGA